jgi:hypothetical protein
MITTRSWFLLVLSLGLPAFLAGLLVGCMPGMSDPWPGEWRSANAQVVQFLPGGKVQLRVGGSVVAEGTYQRLGNAAARIDMKSTVRGNSTSRMQIVRLDDTTRSFRFNRTVFRRERPSRQG